MTGPLHEELADYLALRRALGYRLARPEKLLDQFLDHLDRTGESKVTVVAALDWARLPVGGSSNWWAYRLGAVRGFATYPARAGSGASGACRGAVAAPATAGHPVLVFRL